jgi:serine protease Do
VEGRLIGINTAILSRSGGNQGIGFAIPVNLARSVMDSLVSEGRVTRGYLGVKIQDVTPALAKEFKLKDASGALVGDVTPDSPAEKASLKSGDIVLEFGGKEVKDARHLKLEVAQARPGQSVPVKFLRDGRTETVQVKVKEMPGAQTLAKAQGPDSGDNGTLNGVTVADLDRAARQELNAPENLQGAVITEVQPDSAAAGADLRPGDVIQEINHKPVRNANEAVKMTEHPESKTTLLRIWRNGASHGAGGSHYVVVDESQQSNKAG